MARQPLAGWGCGGLLGTSQLTGWYGSKWRRIYDVQCSTCGFINAARIVRLANRDWNVPDNRDDMVGARLLRIK